MQGQKGAGNSFVDTIDLNQGSVSSTNSPNQHNLRTFGDCHMGESSSSTSPNPQSHGISSSTRVPLNINLNAEHMASGSDNSDAFSYNVENDGALSFKRKALDGEAIDQHDLHSCHNGSSITTSSPPLQTPSFSQPEELNLRIGIGRGVASSDVLNPITVTEIGESSSRNHRVSVNNENDRFNLPPTRNVMRLSDFRPPWSSAANQPQSIHTHEMSRNMPPFPFHENANSRGGGSMTSAFISAERGDSVDRSSFSHGRRNSGSHSPSPWATPQQHGSSRNPQRSSQFYPWAPFPSANSASQFPPLQSDPSSSDETIMPSVTNQGRHHHHHHHLAPFPRPSMMMEFQGDDISEWHALAADIEGRQRLVSEIRNVLNSMRRGDNLRDEDYMLFDPFINGIAEFHDRHREMRLDVDNMSYEELLALEERMGDVNTGLSEEAIMRSMKQRKHLCLFDRSSSNLEPCSICREEYVMGDNVGELDCGHDFHTDCVKQWLTQKNLCPICKTTALAP